MDITLIGWAFISLSIYAIVFKKDNFLLDLLVFSSVFTAAAVFNIEATTTGITPFYFVGFIWIISVFIKYYRNNIKIKDILIKSRNNKLIRALLIFALVIICSEFCLFIFNNKYEYIDILSMESIVISFSKSNITQPIFVIFMIFISILLILELDNRYKITRVMKVFSIATIFSLIWGIAQFCMFYLKIEYPHWLFNNNISYGQLYYQMIYGLKRVNSIALEPSTFALNIIVFLPMILVFWISEYRVFSNHKKNKIFMIIIILLTLTCAVLTTSSTAIVGIGLIVLLLSIYILIFSTKDGSLRKNKKKILVFYLFLIISIIIVFLLATKVFGMYWGTLVDALKDITVNKRNLQTGNERMSAMLTSFNILKNNPILGGGFGSFRSLDLTTNLLSNVGIVGLLSFAYVVYVPLKRAFKAIRKNEIFSVGLGITLLVATIALGIAIPDLIFGYYWILILVTYLYFDEK